MATTEQRSAPLLVSVDEGRKLTQLGESKFRSLLAINANGRPPEIRSLRCGRRILVPIAEIERWIQRQLNESPGAA